MTWELKHGDVLSMLNTIPDHSIQCVVTSPPYYQLRDYGLPPMEWPAMTYAPLPNLPDLELSEWRGCLGLEPNIEMFIGHLVLIFREVHRVLRSDGTCWINMGDKYVDSASSWRDPNGGLPGKKPTIPGSRPSADSLGLKPKDLAGIPWRLAFALQADGWWLRRDQIWAKTSFMPESVTDRCTTSHEYIFHLSKSAHAYFDMVAIREPCTSGPSDIKKMTEQKDRIGGKNKDLDDPNVKANAETNIGRKRGVGNPDGRNRRSVWTIGPSRNTDDHYAAYPEDIPDICLKAGTSARGCCPRCGAPYRRMIEREFVPQEDVSSERGINGAPGQKPPYDQRGWNGFPRGTTRMHTQGWEPTCHCEAGDPIPCTILDPFVGTGTTLVVAERLGLRGIGIDQNTDYLAAAERRLARAFGLTPEQAQVVNIDAQLRLFKEE